MLLVYRSASWSDVLLLRWERIVAGDIKAQWASIKPKSTWLRTDPFDFSYCFTITIIHLSEICTILINSASVAAVIQVYIFVYIASPCSNAITTLCDDLYVRAFYYTHCVAQLCYLEEKSIYNAILQIHHPASLRKFQVVLCRKSTSGIHSDAYYLPMLKLQL